MAQTQTPTPRKHDAARERRVQDEAYTRIVEGFLDTVYYNTVSPFDSSKKLSDHLCRNEYDVEAQKKGADIFLEATPSRTLIVDEKFAINYREKELDTFSFELESKARSNGGWKARPGWFMNPENQTTHYMLLWFKSDHDISTIYEHDACLVSKQAIKDKMKQDGINVGIMFDVFKQITAMRNIVTNEMKQEVWQQARQQEQELRAHRIVMTKEAAKAALDRQKETKAKLDNCAYRASILCQNAIALKIEIDGKTELSEQQTTRFNKVKEELARYGVDIDQLFDKLEKLKYDDHELGDYTFSLHSNSLVCGDYKIKQSGQFEEAPINIIVKKEILQGLARQEFPHMKMHGKTPTHVQSAIDQMERSQQADLSKCVSPKIAELLNTRHLVTGTLYYEREGQKAAQGQIKGDPTQGDKLSVMVDGQLRPIAQFHKGHWFALTPEPVIDNIFKKTVHPFNDMLVQQLQEKHGVSISAMDRMHQPLGEIPEQNFDGMILKVTNPLTNQVEGRFQYHEAINRFVALDNSPLGEKAQVIDGVSIISAIEYMKIRAFADRVADYTREKENRYSGKTQLEAEQYAKRVIAAITSPDWQQTRSTAMEAIAQGLSKAERNEIVSAMTHNGCINAFAEKLMNKEKICGTADLFISCTQEENYRFPLRNQRINTFDLARQVGCQIDEKPGYNGRTNFMINWTPETVAAACAVIKEQNNQPNTQFIFEGYAPTWAMAAFMHECEPNKTFISNKLTGLLDMQGITYGNEGPVQAEAENVARISTIRCKSMVEGVIYPAQIQLPEIEPGQIVFIQGDLPYYAQVAIGEKYGEIAAAVYFEQKNGDFTCGISNHELFTVGDQLSNAKREQVVGQLLQEMAGQGRVGQENGEGQEVEDPDLLPV